MFSPVKKRSTSTVADKGGGGGGGGGGSLFNLTEMLPQSDAPPPTQTKQTKPPSNLRKQLKKQQTMPHNFEPQEFNEKSKEQVKKERREREVAKLKKSIEEENASVATGTTTGGKRRLTAREKERQLLARTRQLDEMIGKLENKPVISEKDIDAIVGYMDSDNSGSVDEAEFAYAILQAKRGFVEDEIITKLLTKLDNELRVKMIRLQDLFKQFDISGDGILSVYELREGLNTLCGASWEKECERRKLKKVAVMGRWKGKEAERDKTKRWLTEAESLPDEFVKERNFFAREVKDGHTFEKYVRWRGAKRRDWENTRRGNHTAYSNWSRFAIGRRRGA